MYSIARICLFIESSAACKLRRSCHAFGVRALQSMSLSTCAGHPHRQYRIAAQVSETRVREASQQVVSHHRESLLSCSDCNLRSNNLQFHISRCARENAGSSVSYTARSAHNLSLLVAILQGEAEGRRWYSTFYTLLLAFHRAHRNICCRE
jgi:hypothetical protein